MCGRYRKLQCCWNNGKRLARMTGYSKRKGLSVCRQSSGNRSWDLTLVSPAFAKSTHGTRFQPVSLSQPLFRLNGNLHVPPATHTEVVSGHQSIVNSVLFHPSLLHIVTAGIERHIILHSPTKSSPCVRDLSFTPTSVRALPVGSPEDHSRFFRAVSSGLGTNNFDEDTETIALFDECVS